MSVWVLKVSPVNWFDLDWRAAHSRWFCLLLEIFLKYRNTTAVEWQRRNWGLAINIRVILTAPDCLSIRDILLYFLILSWVLIVDLELKKTMPMFIINQMNIWEYWRNIVHSNCAWLLIDWWYLSQCTFFLLLLVNCFKACLNRLFFLLYLNHLVKYYNKFQFYLNLLIA